jgi:hypothetical protein
MRTYGSNSASQPRLMATSSECPFGNHVTVHVSNSIRLRWLSCRRISFRPSSLTKRPIIARQDEPDMGGVLSGSAQHLPLLR